jgi:hypothetical protein
VYVERAGPVEGERAATSPALEYCRADRNFLAVLLQRQRYKIRQLAQRAVHRKHVRAAVWSILTWPNRRTPQLNLSPKPIAMSPQIHTYTELRWKSSTH